MTGGLAGRAQSPRPPKPPRPPGPHTGCPTASPAQFITKLRAQLWLGSDRISTYSVNAAAIPGQGVSERRHAREVQLVRGVTVRGRLIYVTWISMVSDPSIWYFAIVPIHARFAVPFAVRRGRTPHDLERCPAPRLLGPVISERRVAVARVSLTLRLAGVDKSARRLPATTHSLTQRTS